MPEVVIPMGREARLYYGPPGSIPNPLSLEFTGIRDLTITLEKESVETQRRTTGAWEDTRESIKRLKLSFDLVNVIAGGTEPTQLTLMRKTFITGTYDGLGAGTGIALYAKSKEATGGGGPEADFIITKFDRAESHGDQQVYSIEASMTQVHGRQPTWSEA